MICGAAVYRCRSRCFNSLKEGNATELQIPPFQNAPARCSYKDSHLTFAPVKAIPMETVTMAKSRHTFSSSRSGVPWGCVSLFEAVPCFLLSVFLLVSCVACFISPLDTVDSLVSSWLSSLITVSIPSSGILLLFFSFSSSSSFLQTNKE